MKSCERKCSHSPNEPELKQCTHTQKTPELPRLLITNKRKRTKNEESQNTRKLCLGTTILFENIIKQFHLVSPIWLIQQLQQMSETPKWNRFQWQRKTATRKNVTKFMTVAKDENPSGIRMKMEQHWIPYKSSPRNAPKELKYLHNLFCCWSYWQQCIYNCLKRIFFTGIRTNAIDSVEQMPFDGLVVKFSDAF